MRLGFFQILSTRNVHLFPLQVCRRFRYLEGTSLRVYWHLRLITSFCPFISTGLMGIRGIDSRTVCHARQSLAYSVETDCHLGLDSAMSFAKWWHEHPLKRLRNVCLLSVPFDPLPTPPRHSFPHWPCSSPRSELLGFDPVLAESATSSECSKGLFWQAFLSQMSRRALEAHHFLVSFLSMHFTWL